MQYDEITILIPSHSLEDFPTELGDEPAAGLLNAFAVAWHPVLLDQAGTMPGWARADDPPDELENRLFIVPSECADWLPGGWADHARQRGAVVVEGVNDRAELLAAVLDPLRADEQSPPSVDAELEADFLALGTCYLLSELLTRYMHHYSNLDESLLQRESIDAAKAAVAGDAEAAMSHLRACFEALAENRERFYPVDCYLIDLCLLIPRLADRHLTDTLSSEAPLSVLVSGEDLEVIDAENPDSLAALTAAWKEGRVDVVGGERRERPTPLMPLESVLWEFDRGRETFQRITGQMPTTWGRRRFGITTQVPQLLRKYGYSGALHIVLDDGLYPDAEQSKIQWEGCDGSVIDAFTRIPLAGDSASSYLRFPMQMAESMEQDHTAAIILARWPEMTTPWLGDFHRIHKYAPALGRFVTLREFFETSDDPGRMGHYHAREYFSPFLVQAVARQEAEPIGRFSNHLSRRQRFDNALWCRQTARVLQAADVGEADYLTAIRAVEHAVEAAGPEGETELIAAADARVAEFEAAAVDELKSVIMHGSADRRGLLLLNPQSFARTVGVDVSGFSSPPDVDGPVKAVQFDDSHRVATVTLPPCGFAWIGPGSGTAQAAPKKRKSAETPLAEEHLLHNEFFEVYLNEETGGIARIKEYGRKPNRLSQQLAYRFPRERVWIEGEGQQAEQFRTHYSQMVCNSSRVTSSGPLVGEIVTGGFLLDQKDKVRLADYTQTVRVWRGRRIVEIEFDLEVHRPPEDNPWTSYYAARFAWNDAGASLTRSVQQGAQGFTGERFESPHYLEIASGEERTTIVNMGLPFHRKTAMRMLDTLLIVAGESRRSFKFVIAVDEPYPMQSAMDAMSPPPIIPTENGPPTFGQSGWFFHLNARNVQLTRILPLAPMDESESEPLSAEPKGAAPAAGFAVRLLETEGRARTVKLQCFKTPTAAHQRDFTGTRTNDLQIDGDAVFVPMTAHEIADVELLFPT